MKKGFTLVELLAVIVILAIILAIAVPTISSLVENSKKSMFQNSAKMILKSMKNDYDGKIASTGIFTDTFILYDNSTKTVYPSTNNLDFTISVTDGGIVRHSDGTVTFALYDGTNCATKVSSSNDIVVTVIDKEACISNIIFKQSFIPFENIIINGNFSNGISNWNNYYTSYNEVKMENDYLAVTGDVSGFFIGQWVPVIQDNVYYSSWKVRMTGEITSNRLYFANAGGYSSYFSNTSTINQWKDLTRISVGTSTGSSRFDIMSYSANYTGKLDIKSVVLLNLTSIYGAGNEPTQSQMDHNINKVWIDTTTNTPKRFTAGGWIAY